MKQFVSESIAIYVQRDMYVKPLCSTNNMWNAHKDMLLYDSLIKLITGYIDKTIQVLLST